MPRRHLSPHLRDHPLVRPGYRRNVGAVVLDTDDRILWCERSDISNSWQFPQGGVTAKEDPLEALLRELTEELGVPDPHTHFAVEKSAPRPVLYRYPEPMLERWVARGKATWLGQEQHYFLLRFAGDDALFTLQPPPGMRQEFRAFTWAGPEQLDLVVEFKREALREALGVFGLLDP